MLSRTRNVKTGEHARSNPRTPCAALHSLNSCTTSKGAKSHADARERRARLRASALLFEHRSHASSN